MPHTTQKGELAVSYTHLDVYKRQPMVFGEDRLRERGSLPAVFFYQGYFLWQTITAANSNRIKRLFAYSPKL